MDWIEDGKGREWGDSALTADCVRVIGESVESEGSKGNCVLTADGVRGFG